jgi:hypothetical protein
MDFLGIVIKCETLDHFNVYIWGFILKAYWSKPKLQMAINNRKVLDVNTLIYFTG